MTIEEARNIYDKFNRKNDNYTEEEFFLYTEAAGLLIRETKDSDCMLNLGGYYYSQKNYDLAFKYYEMSADYGNEFALACLGYIWYYGRTGEVDYKKAYEYFSRAGYNSVAHYKIADMYHNGYYVEKDEANIVDVAENFAYYYEDRIKQGLPAEKKPCFFTKGNYTAKDVEKLILSMPFKRFEDMGYMHHSKYLGILQIDKSIMKSFDDNDMSDLLTYCTNGLEKYWKRD